MSNQITYMNFQSFLDQEGREKTKKALVNLWESVGWNVGLDDPDRLLESFRSSDEALVAVDNGSLVGIATTMTDGLTTFLSRLAIRKDAQGLGIGKTLLGLIEKKYQGYRMVLKTTDKPDFYEKQGYTFSGTGFHKEL